MKRKSMTSYLPLFILSAFVLAFAALMAFGANPDETNLKAQFNRGGMLYDQRQFQKAREIYEEILRTGVNDPAVLYNLGNACARMGDVGSAVLYYTRAMRLSPRDRDIWENLARIQPPINRPNTFFLLKPFAWLKNSVSLNEWTILTSLFFFLTGMILALYMLTRGEGRRRLMGNLTMAFAVIFLFSGVFLSIKVYEELVVRTSIVMKQDTLARSGPGEQFEELYKFPAGTKVRIISDPQGGWVRIRLMDGRSAYLPLTEIRSVNPY